MRYAIRFESSSPLPNSVEKAIHEPLVAGLGRIENFEVTTAQLSSVACKAMINRSCGSRPALKVVCRSLAPLE